MMVDVDGPLSDPQDFLDYLCLELKLPRRIAAECRSFHLSQILNCTVEEVNRAGTGARSLYTADMLNPVLDSQEAISTLDLFYRAYPLTARTPRGTHSTERWIAHLFGQRDVYYAVGHNNPEGIQEGITKLEFCQGIGAKFIIEDNPFEIELFYQRQAETGIIPICFEYNTNRWIVEKYGDEIFRGKWWPIVQHLLHLKGSA